MSRPKPSILGPAAARHARFLPPRPGRGHRNLWEDFRETLLDPEPDPHELETVRRWLRDQLEEELLARLSQDRAHGMVRRACRLSPRMTWKLPHSRARPPARFHRRIVAILLPHELRRLEEQLAVFAFHEGLRERRAASGH